MNLLQLVLDIFLPIKGYDNNLIPKIKTKPSLNNNYPIHIITDYAEIESIIHRIKNEREFAVAGSLNQVMKQGFEEIVDYYNFDIKNSVITFVPPDPVRRLRYEFCLGEYLSHNLGRSEGIPVIQLLKKNQATAKQSYLNREQRIQNMNRELGIFRLNKKWNWRQLLDFGGQKQLKSQKYDTIFLVDDIVTTGATIEACYNVLKKEFSESQIIVIALASNY